MLIRFEDLEQEIWRVLEFLIDGAYLKQMEAEWRRKIKCIFHGSTPLLRSEAIRRPKVDMQWDNATLYVTQKQLWQQLEPGKLCKIWRVMADYIVKYDLLQYGYGNVVEGLNCGTATN